jgi:hypothetical protein
MSADRPSFDPAVFIATFTCESSTCRRKGVTVERFSERRIDFRCPACGYRWSWIERNDPQPRRTAVARR